MQIVEKQLSELKEYANNPRLNDEAVKYVANSIKEFGFKVPIVIDKNNVIVCGHTRFKASKQLKLKSVPCIVADDLTEEQIKAFRLADNKVSEQSQWDMNLLNGELKDLLDLNMADFGFLDITPIEDIPDDLESGEQKKGNVIVSINVPSVADYKTIENELKSITNQVGASLSVKLQ